MVVGRTVVVTASVVVVVLLVEVLVLVELLVLVLVSVTSGRFSSSADENGAAAMLRPKIVAMMPIGT